MEVDERAVFVEDDDEVDRVEEQREGLDRPPVKQQIGRRDARRPIPILRSSGYWPIQPFHFASFASAHFSAASSGVMPEVM